MLRTDKNQCELGCGDPTIAKLDYDGNVKLSGLPVTDELLGHIQRCNGELTTEQVRTALFQGKSVYTNFSRWVLEN